MLFHKMTRIEYKFGGVWDESQTRRGICGKRSFCGEIVEGATKAVVECRLEKRLHLLIWVKTNTWTRVDVTPLHLMFLRVNQITVKVVPLHEWNQLSGGIVSREAKSTPQTCSITCKHWNHMQDQCSPKWKRLIIHI